MKDVNISIIICTMNRSSELGECLDSICKQTITPYELIIVDASSDGSSKRIVGNWKRKSGFRIIYIRTKPGLTKQRNIGIINSRGDVIAFFDDDVVLERSYLKQMVLCFKKFLHVSGATGFIVNNPPKSSLKVMYQRFFLLSGTGRKGKMLRSGFAAFVDPKYVRKYQLTEILSGSNMLFRRSILNTYKFDEAFEGYSQMEDVEFSHRVSKNHRLMFVKNARLVHSRSESERLNLKRHFEMSVFNHYYIFKKNVKNSSIDWILFLWSDIGYLIKCLSWIIKAKDGKSVQGYISGHLKILRHLNFSSISRISNDLN